VAKRNIYVVSTWTKFWCSLTHDVDVAINLVA